MTDIPPSLITEMVAIMTTCSKLRVESVAKATENFSCDMPDDFEPTPTKEQEAQLLAEAVMRWRHS